MENQVIIGTRKVVGKIDSNPYNVFTIMGSGRGWFQSMYFSTINPQSLKGEVIEEIQVSGKDYVYVKLDQQSCNIKVNEFIKSPYIRKDGSCMFGHVREESLLKEIYGCWNDVILVPKKHAKKVAS